MRKQPSHRHTEPPLDMFGLIISVAVITMFFASIVGISSVLYRNPDIRLTVERAAHDFLEWTRSWH